jgi:hypothetical protein
VAPGRGTEGTRTKLLDSATLDSIVDVFVKNKSTQASAGRGNGENRKQTKKVDHATIAWKPDLSLPQRDPASWLGAPTTKRGNPYRTLAPDTAAAKPPPSKKEASKEWFRLPTQEITDDVKADLRVLRLRSAFDTKRFYRKDDSTKFPTQFHFGTVVEHAADYYSGRLSKKQRQRTMAEEVMHDEYLSTVRKKRYNKIQEEATYWSKSQSKGRRTNNPRIKKKPRRKKH